MIFKKGFLIQPKKPLIVFDMFVGAWHGCLLNTFRHTQKAMSKQSNERNINEASGVHDVKYYLSLVLFNLSEGSAFVKKRRSYLLECSIDSFIILKGTLQLSR